jgi:hypothetical protein
LCCLWDNVGKYCRAGQTTWQYGACALHPGCHRLHTHTQNMQYLVLFFETVARTRFSVTLYVYCLSVCVCFFFFPIRNVVYIFRFEMNLLITRRCRGSDCCCWSLTTEVHVLFPVSPREICGAQSDSAEIFYASTSFPSVKIIPKCCIVKWIRQLSEEQAGETWHLKNWLSYVGELRVEEYDTSQYFYLKTRYSHPSDSTSL